MPATQVACPHCAGALPISQITVGKRLRCPRCKTSFTITSVAGDTALATDRAPAQTSTVPDLSALPPLPGALEEAPVRRKKQSETPTVPDLGYSNGGTHPDLPPPRTRPQPVERPTPAPTLPQPAVLPPPRPAPVTPATPGPATPGPQNRGLILGGLLGGILLLAVSSLGLAWHFGHKQDKRQAASGPPSTAPGDATPPGDTSRPAPGPRPSGLDRSDTPAPLLRRNPPPPPRQPVSDPPPLERPPIEPQPGAQAAGWHALSPQEQAKVNKAIDQGVAYLKRHQTVNGSWGGSGHKIGYTALPGLVLLECGVKPDDPAVRKAARAVREAVPKLTATYELALAIFFLDKLGQPQDEPLIRLMGLRLIAGQTANGGWTYHCPLLDRGDDKTLLTALLQTRPRTALDLVVMGPNGKPIGAITNPDGSLPGKVTIRSDGILERPGDVRDPSKIVPDAAVGTLPLDKIGQGSLVGNPNNSGSGTKPIGNDPKNPKPGSDVKLQPLTRVHANLPPSLKHVPALKPPTKDSPFTSKRAETSDNSNTQFGLLGLWAAGRHGVPTERALGLLTTRFRTSQNGDGSWSYHDLAGGGRGGTPSMTCAGLLGLAVGHGLIAGGALPAQKKQDQEIEKGLAHLAEFIEKPLDKSATRGRAGRKPINLYFLWSLERVGVLYNLPKIGGKDWYAWAADVLVDTQFDDGHWFQGGYPGTTATIDTCFALLVLKRANLVKDLSQKLEYLIEVKGIK